MISGDKILLLVFHLCRRNVCNHLFHCSSYPRMDPFLHLPVETCRDRRVLLKCSPSWYNVSNLSACLLSNQERFISFRRRIAPPSTTYQMSLSSFGSFSASGAATPRAPDCSSELGRYVPSVCLFFLTTQKSQQPTAARTMARTPRMTVGATIAAMLVPCKWRQAGQGSVFDNTGVNYWKYFKCSLTVVLLVSPPLARTV